MPLAIAIAALVLVGVLAFLLGGQLALSFSKRWHAKRGFIPPSRGHTFAKCPFAPIQEFMSNDRVSFLISKKIARSEDRAGGMETVACDTQGIELQIHADGFRRCERNGSWRRHVCTLIPVTECDVCCGSGVEVVRVDAGPVEEPISLSEGVRAVTYRQRPCFKCAPRRE